jgi:hypothetical protein
MKKCLDDMVKTSAITFERDDFLISTTNLSKPLENKIDSCNQDLFYDFKFGNCNSWVEITEPVFKKINIEKN